MPGGPTTQGRGLVSEAREVSGQTPADRSEASLEAHPRFRKATPKPGEVSVTFVSRQAVEAMRKQGCETEPGETDD